MKTSTSPAKPKKYFNPPFDAINIKKQFIELSNELNHGKGNDSNAFKEMLTQYIYLLKKFTVIKNPREKKKIKNKTVVKVVNIDLKEIKEIIKLIKT